MIAEQSAGILAGKIALITGAGQGIGAACAAVFVREGARVFAVDFSGAQNDLAARLGPAVVPHHADVSAELEIEAMFAAAIAAFGRVDAVVNVAGTQRARSHQITAADYEDMTATNFRGMLLCTEHGVRTLLRTGGGSITNVSSVGALNADDRVPVVYAASKAAVHSFTKAYAVQYGAQGIRANVIAPGFTLTELTRQSPPEVIQTMSEKAAMKRPGTATEQAEVAAFLTSDRASFVSGAVIPVDGGWSARLA
jgi:NAD(P)-dependent dehydrogenase (short-subunit alcohol dehydrogenase family)